MEHEIYFLRLAAAFIRGRLIQGEPIELSEHLQHSPLDDLSNDHLLQIFDAGRNAGLKLHKFKRTMELARVRRIFGVLHSLQPDNLLDIGSGRGTFLWPLLNEFEYLPVTSVDFSELRAENIQAVKLGGVDRLAAFQMNATDLQFEDSQFDVVTMLEVLEHIPEPAKAVNEVVRVANRFVVLSVPSKPDDNPEHIHLFNEDSLTKLFTDAGVEKTNFDYVLNHIVVVANIGGEN